ncbi:hypothetical protein IWZ03DRAFT_209841 [Phyllosticta citriasiana]|uniref:Uncharacterized protein n=1 Tax=Phyllosticta citriasiana TaxID=595635 RepID=A0ABR1KP01_9PEZI
MSFVDSLTAKNSHHQTSPHRGPPGYTASFRHLRTTNRLFFANFFSRVFHKYSMELSSPTRGSSTNPFQFWQSRRSEAPARPNRQGGSTCPFSPLSSPFLSVIIAGPAAAKHAPSVIAAIIRRHRSSPTSVRAPSLARTDAENARKGREARDSTTNRRPPSAPLGVLSLLLPLLLLLPTPQQANVPSLPSTSSPRRWRKKKFSTHASRFATGATAYLPSCEPTQAAWHTSERTVGHVDVRIV